MSNTTTLLTRSFNRFSSSHDPQHAPSSEATASAKRSSKLNDFMSRSRTASLPPRPHTSGDSPLSSRQKLSARLGNLKGKGKERGDGGVEGAQSFASRAASSVTSVADPFAATASDTTSFVTYSPVMPPPSHTPAPLNLHPQAAESTTPAPSIYSPPGSPTVSSQPPQHVTSSTRRRGSILVAASDALSSIARKAPMRSLQLNIGGLGRQGSGKGANIINSSQPIVLTEVIEISESAIRASKLREEEERERERLRDAAARALGIGEGDIDSSSMGSRRQPGFGNFDDTENEEDLINGTDQEFWDDAVTPTATTLPSLPIPLAASHSRSRSGSYILPHNSLSSAHRPSTPLSAALASQLGVSNLPPVRNHSGKSLSTPPAPTTPSLTLNIRNSSKTRMEEDSSSAPPPEIPSFPCTPSSLTQFIQRAGTIPRYYPAPSLLMFTLSKQWKNRYMVLTSPIQPPAPSTPTPIFNSPWIARNGTVDRVQGTTPLPWYLHLFKGSGQDEKELERLEINEESVVYVAEGEVGGRRGVIKVGGCLRKKLSLSSPRPSSSSASAGLGSRTSSSSMGSADGGSEGGSSGTANSDVGSSQGAVNEGMTMWVLQIIDPEEAKEWIGAIKGSVLSQRSIRAGLGVPTVMNGLEPRGDLDVVLSMRVQGLLSSAISPIHRLDASSANGREMGAGIPSQSNSPSDSSPVSLLPRAHPTTIMTSVASASASATAESSPVSPTPHTNGTSSPIPRPAISATTALKSLFTIGGGRPRSPSTVSYAPPPSPTDDSHDISPEDSFGLAGTSLMGMNRTNSYVTDRPLSPAVSISATPRVGTPIIPNDTHLHLLERKILPDSDRHLVENEMIGEPITIRRADGNGMSMGVSRGFDSAPIMPSRVSSDGIVSPSLQPPPRKRAGTINAASVPASTPEESMSYSYAHANGSTAESLGVNVAPRGMNLLSPSPPMPATPLPQSTRLKDRRMRTSWSSVSTYGSTDQSPSSPDDIKPRRWSRRSSLTHRMSSPYPPRTSPPSSPKSPVARTPSNHHPYASESNSLSRSSSIGSGQSRISELYTRPFSSKRASGSSVQSFSTASTTQGPSGVMLNKAGLSSPKPRSGHRVSAPPPQRPAPNSALPPTPSEDSFGLAQNQSTHSIAIHRTSFRESLTMRGKRLSTVPPTLPPSSVLPPTPSEPGYRAPLNAHRRSSSQGNPNDISSFNTLRSSPTHGKAPFPPPNTPLPPPPSGSPVMSAPSSPTRPVSTIKRRFRILSSPPTSLPSMYPPITPLDIPTSTSFNPYAIPESPIRPAPIGEPITTMQNDPSFLLMSPPTPPRSPVADLDLQGLSPPPRRSSRQVSAPDVEKLEKEIEPSVEAVLFTADEDTPSVPAPAPPPEVDDFASLLTPVRSSDHSAVSLVDVRI